LNCFFARSNVGRKARTGVIKGVDDAQRTGACKTTRGHVDGKELGEFCALIGLREHGLDTILEREVERLGGEVTDDVCQVTTPESADSLLLRHTGEAVDNASVSGNLPTDDFGVGILGLDKELHTLDGSSASFRHGSGDATGKEVDHEVRHVAAVCVRLE